MPFTPKRRKSPVRQIRVQIGAYILAGFYGPLLALFFSLYPA
jgi:hypothetical protein